MVRSKFERQECQWRRSWGKDGCRGTKLTVTWIFISSMCMPSSAGFRILLGSFLGRVFLWWRVYLVLLDSRKFRSWRCPSPETGQSPCDEESGGIDQAILAINANMTSLAQLLSAPSVFTSVDIFNCGSTLLPRTANQEYYYRTKTKRYIASVMPDKHTQRNPTLTASRSPLPLALFAGASPPFLLRSTIIRTVRLSPHLGSLRPLRIRCNAKTQHCQFQPMPRWHILRLSSSQSSPSSLTSSYDPLPELSLASDPS